MWKWSLVELLLGWRYGSVIYRALPWSLWLKIGRAVRNTFCLSRLKEAVLQGLSIVLGVMKEQDLYLARWCPPLVLVNARIFREESVSAASFWTPAKFKKKGEKEDCLRESCWCYCLATSSFFCNRWCIVVILIESTIMYIEGTRINWLARSISGKLLAPNWSCSQ